MSASLHRDLASAMQRGSSIKRGLIMVGIDDTPASLRLLEFVSKLFSSHDILLVHVHCKDFYPSAGEGGGGFFLQEGRNSVDAGADELQQTISPLRRSLRKWEVSDYQGAGGEYRTELLRVDEMGNKAISTALCKRAEELHPEILVLSKHSRKAINKFFMGSVTEDCIRHAPCPILIV